MNPLKIFLTFSVAILSVLLIFNASAYAQNMGSMPGGYDHMGHGNPMMGMGMMGSDMMGKGMGPFDMLDLTDKQRDQINKLMDARRKSRWSTMGKIMDESAKLRDLYYEESLNSKKILAVYDKIFALKRDMIAGGVDTINQIRKILTKEQHDQLKSHMREMYKSHMHGREPAAKKQDMGPHMMDR